MGFFGNKTKTAVIKFQEDYNLVADGIVGPKTSNALEDVLPILRYGSTGEYVIQLQTTLLEMGYLKSAVDGYFGQKTLEAVINFQHDNDLNADGIVGKNTWAKLESGYPILKLGCTGGYVSVLQTKLTDLGYDCGEIDGRFGSMTHYAVTAFQNNNSLTADGIVGKNTWAELNSEDPVASANDWIELGDTGTKVENIQDQLVELGYDIGSDDGTFGTDTRNAVKKFQTDNGIQIDGIVGPQTWEALFDSYPVLKQGSTGTYVSQVQTILNSLGYNCGTVDGIFGSGTKGKVQEFQRNNGLMADGIVGAATWSALTSDNPVESYSSVVFQKGSRGETVRKIQVRLEELGYSCGRASADGIFGTATENAIKEFQRANSLTVDGIVGTTTRTTLFSTTAVTNHFTEEGELLKIGVSGTAVTTLQQALIALGYDCGNQGADGIFGPATYRAVIEFQRYNGCVVDGIVGPETQAALDSPEAQGPPDEDEPIEPYTNLQRGSRGEAVKQLQKCLIELGYSCGGCAADGVFGPATQNAVVRFQQNNGLTANGIVDQDTMEALKSPDAKGPIDAHDYYYGDALAYAEQVIMENECSARYDAVNPSDNGSSLSIGLFQWHGSNAYDLLFAIKELNPLQAENILDGTTIYSELLQNNHNLYNDRVLNETETQKVKTLLVTNEGMQAQDDMRKAYIESYFSVGESLGITDEQCLIFFADAYNKSRVAAKRMVATAGGGSTLTLDKLYKAAIEDDIEHIGYEIERRTKTYEAAKKFISNDTSETFDRLIDIAMQEYYSGEREATEDDPDPRYEGKPEGWTKYGSWYGLPCKAWCNMFVSWCANKAGILGTLVKKTAGTETSKIWYESKSPSAYKTVASAYVPRKGDCIYYLDQQLSGRSVSHIGFVREDSDGTIVKTVEGNWGNEVTTREIDLTDETQRWLPVGFGDIREVASQLD